MTTAGDDSLTLIGIMSGTSMDGVDLVAAAFFKTNNGWQYTIKATATYPFPKDWQDQLSQAHRMTAMDLLQLDGKFGTYLGQLVNDFLANHPVQPLLIASHGHTVYHSPDAGVSCQIGNGEALSLQTGIPVVNDFRQADVFLGGQGAPLVPIGDAMLFPAYDYCLNLGGIANTSYEDKNGQRLAYDIAPCNLVFNQLAREAGFTYDENGHLARQGRVDEDLMAALDHLPYYAKKGPKSLHKSDVEQIWMPVLESHTIPLENKMATFSRHLAKKLVQSMEGHGKKQPSVLVTGGGAFNDHLIDQLSQSNVQVTVPEDQVVEYKEALIFAFLGFLRMQDKVNCLSSVTGASRDHSAGVWHGPLKVG